MRSGSGYSGHHPVSLRDKIMDDMDPIGMCNRKNTERLLDTLKSRFEAGDRRWIVVDKIDGKELIQSGEIRPIGLLIKAMHQTFIVFA